MNATTHEETIGESYALIINGFAPELWHGVMFRRAGRFNAERQKTIKCPYCGRYLIAVSVTTTVEIYRYPSRVTVQCHEYKTCNICHKKVGIVFA